MAARGRGEAVAAGSTVVGSSSCPARHAHGEGRPPRLVLAVARQGVKAQAGGGLAPATVDWTIGERGAAGNVYSVYS